ncbi:MAG: putative sporulation protein YtxC [Clostridia bacterium]|nr:putative sporulation protein YtxC [Clostridia bacterium]
MDSLSIVCDADIEEIGKNIAEAISGDELDYILVEKIPHSSSNRYFLTVKTDGELSSIKISEIIGSWIVNVYIQTLVRKMLGLYFSQSDLDKKRILESASKKTSVLKNNYYKEYVVKKLTKYFETENSLIIDGFLRFRLFEYREEVFNALYDAVEEFYAEKEYEEFLELISAYIKEKPAMIDLLHIKHDFDGKFYFYDFKKNNIAVDIEKSDEINLIENFLTREDILMSILITLAPKRIIWHNKCQIQNLTIMNTVSELFKERFSVCKGCELCET